MHTSLTCIGNGWVSVLQAGTFRPAPATFPPLCILSGCPGPTSVAIWKPFINECGFRSKDMICEWNGNINIGDISGKLKCNRRMLYPLLLTFYRKTYLCFEWLHALRATAHDCHEIIRLSLCLCHSRHITLEKDACNAQN